MLEQLDAIDRQFCEKSLLDPDVVRTLEPDIFRSYHAASRALKEYSEGSYGDQAVYRVIGLPWYVKMKQEPLNTIVILPLNPEVHERRFSPIEEEFFCLSKLFIVRYNQELRKYFTDQEHLILSYLVEHSDGYVSPKKLAQDVLYRESQNGFTAERDYFNLRMRISSIKKKLKHVSSPMKIKTGYKFGYRIVMSE